jgi:predicted acylesterase/phospholipase RssA
MTIKNLVLPGGGPNLPILYGVFKKLSLENAWKIENIETIHATSCGSIIAIILLLTKIGMTFDDIDDYLINRPWHLCYSLTPEMLMAAYSKKGFVDESHFLKGLLPLFAASNIDCAITLKQLYDITNIDFYLYTTNFTEMKLVTLSHYTHPDFILLDAIYVSSTLPLIVQPKCIDNILYIDGAIFSNNPIQNALDTGINESEVLGCRISFPNNDNSIINNDSNMFDYFYQLLTKLAAQCDRGSPFFGGPPNIPHLVDIEFESGSNSEYWTNILGNKDFRKDLIESGGKFAVNYLDMQKNL